jgi:hypothetical protein
MDVKQMSNRVGELLAQGKTGVEIYEQLVREGVEEKMRTHIEFVISATQTSVIYAYLEALLCLGWGLQLPAARAIVEQAQAMCNEGDEMKTFKDVVSTAVRLANTLAS